jgi:hypothetical protein
MITMLVRKILAMTPLVVSMKKLTVTLMTSASNTLVMLPLVVSMNPRTVMITILVPPIPAVLILLNAYILKEIVMITTIVPLKFVTPLLDTVNLLM